MTITVAILVPQGMVFAADSRQVLQSRSGHMRTDSDNAEKIYRLGPRLALMINGQDTYYLNEKESPQSIGKILQVTSARLPKNGGVGDAAIFLHHKVDILRKKHITVTKDENACITFFVGGYSLRKNIGELYRCDSPGRVTLERKTSDAGVVWNGEREIINRVLLGYDRRLFEILESQAKPTKIQRENLHGLQLHINFQTMPLRDAVELAVILVRTTIDFQRFSDGLVGRPGQYPTCGGPIDVVAITYPEGFRWVQQKALEVRSG